MVEVIIAERSDHTYYGGGQPRIEVHHIERAVHGNSIAIKVYGEMKIAAKEVVFARELKLNTLEVLVLTPETGDHWLYHAQKWIYRKGEFNNYASIDILIPQYAPYEMLASGAVALPRTRPTSLPDNGSIWLNFIALGE